MKRFAFMALCVGIPALMIGLLVGWHFSSADAALRDQVALLSHNLESHRHRRATEDKYDLRIVGAAAKFTEGDFAWQLKGEPLNAQQVLDALPGILTELDRYPIAALKAAGLHRIVLCGTLSIQDKPEGGLADASSGTIYLSIPMWDAADPSVLHAIHHEIYHLIDATAFVAGSDDKQWSSHNPKGFKYGKSGLAAAADMQSVTMTDQWPGFVTPYSRSAVEEDKAETYACMMNAPAAVAERIKSDPIVAAKVKLIRGRCAELCPELKP